MTGRKNSYRDLPATDLPVLVWYEGEVRQGILINALFDQPPKWRVNPGTAGSFTATIKHWQHLPTEPTS